MKKLYIITTAGGLGNQMMNYCLWYYMRYKLQKSAYLYPKLYQLKDHNGYEIGRIFPNTIPPSPSRPIYDELIKILTWIDTKAYNVSLRIGVQNIYRLFQEFLPIRIINFPNWKNYIFIEKISKDLHEIFYTSINTDEKNYSLITKIQNENSVSIHIRRGDYQNITYWRKILGDICDVKYYKDCLNYINKQIDNPQYYIFSDDILWAKENLAITGAMYVNWNKGIDSWKDMIIMSHCRVNILANSTFSLMGAWLNQRKDAIRIAPTKWRNYYKDTTADIYIPKSWIHINNDRPFVCLRIKPKDVSRKQIEQIFNSSYTDFVIQVPKVIDGLTDDRIVHNEIQAHHYIDIYNLENFSSRYYLAKLLDNEL